MLQKHFRFFFIFLALWLWILRLLLLQPIICIVSSFQYTFPQRILFIYISDKDRFFYCQVLNQICAIKYFTKKLASPSKIIVYFHRERRNQNKISQNVIKKQQCYHFWIKEKFHTVLQKKYHMFHITYKYYYLSVLIISFCVVIWRKGMCFSNTL